MIKIVLALLAFLALTACDRPQQTPEHPVTIRVETDCRTGCTVIQF